MAPWGLLSHISYVPTTSAPTLCPSCTPTHPHPKEATAHTDHILRYATTFAGWFTIALVNTYLCQYLGFGLILTVGAALQLSAQILRCWLPPFPLYAVTFFLQSLGMALQDTHSNNFVTRVKGAHRWLGVIHAMYALGTLVGPTVATAVASNSPGKWYLYYTVLVGIGSINLILVAIAFRGSMKNEHTPTNPQSDSTTTTTTTTKKSALDEMKAVIRLPSVWLLSLYFFFFLGAVLTASGWTVQYLVTVRNGKLSEVGYVQTGFAGGAFLGRLLLAEPTKRLGERRMIFVYAVLCLGLELLFWLLPNIIAGAVAISLFGFFSGPFFATGVSVGAQIFPPELRSSSLGMYLRWTPGTRVTFG